MSPSHPICTVQSISLIDFSGLRLSHAGSSAYHEALGRAGKLAECIYPQLLERSVIYNPPSFVLAAFPLFRMVLSSRLVQKMGVCPATGRAGASLASCPFAGRFVAASVPTFLGG
jgi:hypothetical protein